MHALLVYGMCVDCVLVYNYVASASLCVHIYVCLCLCVFVCFMVLCEIEHHYKQHSGNCCIL